MSEIVKRLNRWGTGSPDCLLLMREAAEVIEFLQADNAARRKDLSDARGHKEAYASHLNALIEENAALKEQLAQVGWFSIESAPKDGTDFWGAERGSFNRWEIEKCCFDFDHFFFNRSRKANPSLWMPIPATPTTGQEG